MIWRIVHATYRVSHTAFTPLLWAPFAAVIDPLVPYRYIDRHSTYRLLMAGSLAEKIVNQWWGKGNRRLPGELVSGDYVLRKPSRHLDNIDSALPCGYTWVRRKRGRHNERIHKARTGRGENLLRVNPPQV